ncbi:MAG: hypothetical protein AABX28_00650 [Nanoarchaeota archaeon]
MVDKYDKNRGVAFIFNLKKQSYPMSVFFGEKKVALGNIVNGVKGGIKKKDV